MITIEKRTYRPHLSPEETFRQWLADPDENGCELWQGSLKGPGSKVGVFGTGGKTWKAHRYAWTMANGAIPAGAEVRNECGNRLCCNASHWKVWSAKKPGQR